MKKNLFWKIVFHSDTMIPVFGLVLVWFTITLLYDQFTTFQSLRKHSGVIRKSEFVITHLKNKPLFKDTTREMRLFLNEDSIYYIITTKNLLPEFNDLFWGDTVNLYTKDKWLWIFGFAENKIAHLERVRDGKVFIDYEKGKQAKKWAVLFTTAGAAILFWLFVRRTKRKLYLLRNLD